MSMHFACTAAANPPVPCWSAAFDGREDEERGTVSEDDDTFVAPAAARPTASSDWTEADRVRLAQDFLTRTEPLIDAVAPPSWEDAEDIFAGEVFEEESMDYQASAMLNLSFDQKAEIVEPLMKQEARRSESHTPGSLMSLALTYRRILLDRSADPRDKVEILRRVYTDEEPEWMTAEIVYLHFVLLDQCRYLTRASASLERKKETLGWIFTDPVLEDRPFSFKNCVCLATGNPPDFGAVYAKAKELMVPALAAWLQASLAKKAKANSHQTELF